MRDIENPGISSFLNIRTIEVLEVGAEYGEHTLWLWQLWPRRARAVQEERGIGSENNLDGNVGPLEIRASIVDQGYLDRPFDHRRAATAASAVRICVFHIGERPFRQICRD